MSTTPEGKVKKAVRDYLRKKGVWFYQPVQNGMGVVGIPDFICCWHGHFIAIETKAPGKLSHVTPNQQRVIEAIREHGGLAVVVDSVDSLQVVLENLEGLS
jgi:hypothetical protein